MRQSSGRRTIIQQALAILAKYGSAANLYLPGIGAINGITAGNWLDSAGATAATVDNPVGLVVSAAKEVGPELVTNGDFSSGSTGWSVPAGWAVSSGVCVATTTSASFKQIATVCTAGKSYRVEFDWTHGGGTLYVRVGAGTATTFTTSGRKSVVLTANGINGFESYGGTVSGTIDNISVRELTGAHLTQATAANRPILRRGLVNLLTQSDFQSGVTDAPTRGGLVTASAIAGYGGALAFSYDGATASYAYKAFSALANTQYTTCVVVKMDDSGAPTFGSSVPESPLNTFSLVCQSEGINPLSCTKAQLADGCWLVCVSYLKPVVVGVNFGVAKYATNNSRTFRVTRYGLFVGQYTAQQIIAAGGIPLTTTAPESSTNGPFAWDFVSSDSFTTAMTPGNAGFFCSGAQVNDFAVLRTLLGAGAGSDASSGVWLARAASNALMLQVGNGTTRNSIGAPYPVATNAVASAGWDSSTMFVGINNTETSGAKSVNCTSSNTMNIGVLTGTTNPMLGTIGATIIMPTVLPTASERATLRQFIASLSGVTM